jgi:Ca2+-binding RTX toxin-like protein
VLVGGGGNDIFTAGTGRSILIGGNGKDSLKGGGADDLIIGGFTDFDTNAAALASLLAEWQSANAYATRVSNLKNGGGLNGSNKLVLGAAGTVHDDAAPDTLTGGAGLDWFFANTSEITDLLVGQETVN